MKKRGFTLIELLGVIIILGSIATLITYSIINVIEDARRDSAIQSAEQLIRSVTLDYTEKDNFTTDQLNVLDYNYEGSKPEYGYIQFNENENPRLYMLYNGYCVTKGYDGELEARKLNKDEVCDWYTNSNVIKASSDSILTLEDALSTNLLDYKIYGKIDEGYIESTGTQYIDTGYIPKTNTKIELEISFNGDFKDINTYGGGSVFFGSSNDSSTFSANFGAGSNQSSQIFPWVELYDGTKSYSITVDNIILSARNLFTLESGLTTYASLSSPNAEKVNDLTDSLVLFGRNLSGVVTPFTSYNMRLYTCKIYEGDNLVRDFIPYEYNGEVGLFDKVENKFYSNAGTGTFNYKSSNALGSLNDEGKYQIDTKVSGKNLFDLSSSNGLYSKYTGITNTINDNELKVTCSVAARGGYFLLGKFEPGEYYIGVDEHYSSLDGVNTNIGFTVMSSDILYGTMTRLGGIEAAQNYININLTQEKYVYLYHAVSNSNDYYIIKNVMVKKGSESNKIDYEPYKENVTSIYLDEPLRCVGDVCDYIDYGSNGVIRYMADGYKLEKVDLPSINLYDGYNNILVTDGEIIGTQLEVVALKK